MKSIKGFISVLLSAVMLLTLSFGLVMFKACVNVDKFDRAVAALQTAPALIESFTNSTPAERQRLEGYFADAVSALKSYRVAQTDENWGSFISVLVTIASHQVSDSTGAARIAAIVGLVRVILGIPEEVLATARRGGTVHVERPDLRKINKADVEKLERLMKPLPPH